ncbi:MAG: ATP-binding protein, partial [Methyloprofundus sp.]|nr:ATP-binding protein [Methyloprofundus sp.]
MWNNCLSKLENELPSQEFNTWIRPLQAIENNNQIKLLAPNQFVLDWVKEHFLNQIETTINDFSNGEILLVLAIGSKTTTTSTLNTTKLVKKSDKSKYISNLNPMFTFENFVVGKSNQLAKAASIQVAEHLGSAYNPLLIYGCSGLGKTHLMHAIGNKIFRSNPNANVVYLHSEKFVQDMVKALQHNTIAAFKDFYRNVDALLIDDIQFFAGKERSQEEFFHTFNNLLDKKHQVVLT